MNDMGGKCGLCNFEVPINDEQIGRKEKDGSITVYHMYCEGRARDLKCCEDCGKHRAVCDDCKEERLTRPETPLTRDELIGMIRAYQRVTAKTPTALHVTESKFNELMQDIGMPGMVFDEYFQAFRPPLRSADIRVLGLQVVPIKREYEVSFLK